MDLWELKIKLKIKVFWVGDRPKLKLRITFGIILYRANNYLEEIKETPLSA